MTTTLTSAQRDENRLTAADRATIRARMVEALAQAKSEQRGYVGRWGDVEMFARIGWHAIGCREADLRDSETAEVRRMAMDILSLTANAQGHRWEAVVGIFGNDPCDACHHTIGIGARAWFCQILTRRLCDPCMSSLRAGQHDTTHDARPDDLPEEGDRCKDCGQPITWLGPELTDWVHADSDELADWPLINR